MSKGTRFWNNNSTPHNFDVFREYSNLKEITFVAGKKGLTEDATKVIKKGFRKEQRIQSLQRDNSYILQLSAVPKLRFMTKITRKENGQIDLSYKQNDSDDGDGDDVDGDKGDGDGDSSDSDDGYIEDGDSDDGDSDDRDGGYGEGKNEEGENGEGDDGDGDGDAAMG